LRFHDQTSAHFGAFQMKNMVNIIETRSRVIVGLCTADMIRFRWCRCPGNLRATEVADDDSPRFQLLR